MFDQSANHMDFSYYLFDMANRGYLALTLVILNAIFAILIYRYITPGRQVQEGDLNKKTTTLTPLAYRDYTLEELRPFNGNDKEHILLAIDFRIYDVSSAAHHYGPEGSYGALAGRDASRSLATHKIIKINNREKLQEWDDLNDLDITEREALNEWVAFFDEKYKRVGTLVPNHSWAGSDNEETDYPRGAILTSHEDIFPIADSQ